MKEGLTKFNLLLSISAIILMTLFSCNVAQTPVESQQAIEESVNEPLQLSGLIPYDTFTETLSFENGMTVEQFLSEKGMTKKELYNELCGQLERELQSEINNDSRSIIGPFDIDDIMKNPSHYFTGSITPVGSEYQVDIGFSRAKINQVLGGVPEQKVNSLTYLSDFSVAYFGSRIMAMDLKITFKLRYKLGPIPIRWSPNLKVRLMVVYSYNANSYSIFLHSAYGMITNTNVKLLKLFKAAMNLFGQELAAGAPLLQSIRLNFLETKYLTFQKVYSSNDFITIRFHTKKKDLNALLAKAKKYGFTFVIN